tara:strand:+ start:454 stop:1707 length:1254 start_codon:yes stop_codon:yes gene_type:complete
MIKKTLLNIGLNALNASQSKLSNKKKNKVLSRFAYLIKKNKKKILVENKKDLSLALSKGLKANMIKRLELNEKKIKEIITSINNITQFKDPVNVTLGKWKVKNGLEISRVTMPIGVIGVIYESRPNVTSDVASLCFKSGNSVILKGGSEAFFSNLIISNLFRKALVFSGINKNFVQFIKNKSKNTVKIMLSDMEKYIDVIIPRGGRNLVKIVQQFSKIPTIGHLEGVCHTYIDKEADLKISKRIILNAKMRNTSICGATETLLIHEKILNKFVNPILSDLEKHGCKIYADKKIMKIYTRKCFAANKNSWGKEYLSAAISVKSVKNLDEALNHINKYGTMHTDAIITKNNKIANIFFKNVKSSIAIQNSSTQFADGGEFGFGGEVGISTNKLPPRGPVGLSKLVTYKYQIKGKGQIRE